jgi:hypothetical protein
MYAFVLLLAAATAFAEHEPGESFDGPQLAGGTAICRPDIRGSEERLMRAFMAGGYWPTSERRFRCRIA